MMRRMQEVAIVGRSSSHFTRVARLFAHELGVRYEFRPVFDLTSLSPADYVGNPALKIPVLVDEKGSLFGCENVCRELAVRSGKRESAVLRGDSRSRVVANAEELTHHVMSSEVVLIMAKMAGDARLAGPKVARSIDNCLRALDTGLDDVLAALPPSRTISFFEAALFAVVTHLPWREIMDVTPYARLAEFCRAFGDRESARATEYRFDAQPAT